MHEPVMMFHDLIERVTQGLDRFKIPYMMIGGQAVLVYGEPRLTRDIDLTLGIDVDRLPDIIALTREEKFEILVENPEEFTTQTMTLPCQDPISRIRIDFVFSWLDYERQAIERGKKFHIGAAEVNFAAPEDLIIQKLIAHRPRDIEDVSTVLLKQKDLDEEYIRSWLVQFSEVTSRNLVEAYERLRNSLQA